ncbi:protein kinase [Rhodobacter sphaeroides]|uniref:serine/threonine protein kinase n=1 Tax=Cereibacter sphaeroides TaxID=1063 RepID=UPI00132591E7|nr:protein kinase [Cereibacter sphaeroides]MWP38058.1 protein kinase [Cereibacter sphaeroides]
MPFDINLLPANVRPAVQRLQETIEFSDNITKGANGYVLIGRNHLLDRVQVVKVYYWGRGKHVEPALLAKLESPNVLKVDGAEKIDEDDAYFITRYCGGGDLDDQLAKRAFGPLEGIDILLQIASGVSYLHGQGYLHRDLKPSNVFYTDDDAWVIGDFGSVVTMNDEGFASTQSKHSIIYRPPEDFDVPACFYRQGDIYQLGILLYQILGGRLDYKEDSWLTPRQLKHRATLADIEAQMFSQSCIESVIRRGKVLDLDTLPATVPDHLRRLIRHACRTDYLKRHATTSDFISKLNNLRKKTFDWRMVDELYQLDAQRKSFRIVPVDGDWQIEKRVRRGWKIQRGECFDAQSRAVARVEYLAS